MSPSEYFTYLFYTWESRGRGWYVFDQPVYLEPPYIPFVRYFPKTGFIDESKRPTLVSSLIDKLTGKKHPTHEEEEEVLDYETLEPFTYDDDLDLAALQVKLPKESKISPEVVKAMLGMLSSVSSNISFEIIGNVKEIVLQFVCNEKDKTLVKTALASYFPNYIIIENNQYLEIILPDRKTHSVDFGLREEFMRPLQVVKNFTLDPLTAIIGILDTLKTDECAGIQMLFQGAVNNWTNSIVHSVTANDGKSFFQDSPEAPKLALEKVSSPLFGVCIRAFSQEANKDHPILSNLATAIIQATKGVYNELMVFHHDAYDKDDRISDICLRESHRLGMLLCADELVTLLHFPSNTISSKKLFHTGRKTVEVPSIAKNKQTVLGTNRHNSIVTKVTYSIEDRLKHTHVIGATGTGKSTLLAQLVLQDIEQGLGIALFDPHGDLVDDIVARLPNHALDRVIIIDPSDSEYPVGINILQAHNDLEKEVLSSDLVSAFRRLSTSWGDQMNTVFANAILAILESSTGGTLNDLRRFLVEPSFRKSYLQQITDPTILYYWLKEYPLLKTNSIGPILTRLDTFLRPRVIRNMVSQKTGLNFESILTESKILLIKLPQGLIGKENSYLLGSLILSKLHQAAFARQAKQHRPPFFIYLDEFHNFITPSIREMLSGVRKYHVGLILSHQDLQQLQREDTELLNSVLGNTYTRIVFRVGEPDAKKLQDGFSDFDYTDFQNLGRGEAILRIEQPNYNTSFNTEALVDVDSNAKELLYAQMLMFCRHKYATSKADIEKEIFESLHISQTDSLYTEEKIVRKKDVSEIKEEAPKKVDILPIVSIPILVDEEMKPETQKDEPTVVEPKADSTHKYLQNLVKKFGESLGYTATLEASLTHTDGNVDVLLTKESKTIAVEICVSTDPVWEVHNIRKCVEAKFDMIVSLSGDPKQLEKIKKKYNELHTDGNNIAFFTPDAFFAFLESSSVSITEQSSNESTMKGYRINVSYDSISQNEMNQRKSAVASVILNSMKKKK